ncbi:unnamed protein product, partial [Brenthis ino]
MLVDGCCVRFTVISRLVRLDSSLWWKSEVRSFGEAQRGRAWLCGVVVSSRLRNELPVTIALRDLAILCCSGDQMQYSLLR